MRILSGKLKNSNLIIKGDSSKLKPILRPTGAVVKKSLFSTLSNSLKDSFFLDVFAGSGAVGMEAFSNGAKFIAFIEKEKSLYWQLKENIKKYDLPAIVLLGSYKNCLSFFKKKNIRFNFIFIDPPYRFLDYEGVVSKILNLSLLEKDGAIIIERESGSGDLSKEFLRELSLERIKERKIGGTVLSYFSLT